MRKSPAQIYALTFGATLLLVGVIGFFYTADFSTGDATTQPANRDSVFGVFAVNGWHNVVHVMSGLLGLALAGSWFGARMFALGFGAVYLAVAAWGFIVGDGDSILGLIPVNSADNWLHVAIAVLGLLAGFVTPTAPAPSTSGHGSPALEPSVRRVSDERAAR